MIKVKTISVVIPLYNVANYVGRATTSVASQVFDGLEIVLVDDGSEDGSLSVAMSHLQGLDVVTIVQENAGLSVARNEGILASSGKYILFLDADDFILPNSFEKILNVISKEEPDVLFGRYLRWSPNTGYFPIKHYNYKEIDDPKERMDYILSGLPEPSWNAWRYVCKREWLIERELFFEAGLLCEDVPWSVSLLDSLNRDEKFSFLPEPFYAYYYHRSGSIMNQLNVKRLIELNSIMERLLEKYKDRTAICRVMVWDSFSYINEYWLFGRAERKQIYESYKSILPKYKLSNFLPYKIVGLCGNPFALYLLSICLWSAKSLKRLLLKGKRKAMCF